MISVINKDFLVMVLIRNKIGFVIISVSIKVVVVIVAVRNKVCYFLCIRGTQALGSDAGYSDNLILKNIS
jgi:hypothetical protein